MLSPEHAIAPAAANQKSHLLGAMRSMRQHSALEVASPVRQDVAREDPLRSQIFRRKHASRN